jgi:four helix bundle protein
MYDLENRLLGYAADAVRLVEKMPRTRAGNHIGNQLLRSSTAPLLNHGEVQAAESPNDFVHKMRVCLKELRESQRSLRLIIKIPLVKNPGTVEPLLRETDELIRIFVASIRTAEKNMVRKDESDGDKA